uniref:NADH-ubiquinone oxidoreductase chain 1 n=1 Tax=Microdevario kubotai TaxID=857698 RepID=A0A060PL89_9TELE|nr:NADH dehydrogenase subunit 1 [Microdevario kubotai]
MSHLNESLSQPVSLCCPSIISCSIFDSSSTKNTRLYATTKGPKRSWPPRITTTRGCWGYTIYYSTCSPIHLISYSFPRNPHTSTNFYQYMLWAPMPLPHPIINMNLGVLFIMALSSLAVYSILGSGWASNSKYALIGALRAVAQTISYEVSLGLILLSAIILSGGYTLQTFSMAQQNTWLLLPLWPLAIMWFISTLAETNRAPFDLTEGESELVSGFNVEYAGGPFALFFLAEYANILFMNTLSVILFLGALSTYNLPELMTINLLTKTALLTALFLWMRASYPRFRYDQLMHLIWKNFLPVTLILVLWNTALPIALAGLPPHT